ncbi:MAG: EutN/CcmL family microcompartment protein [Planctomycetia bacterium]|nr:EutN/CcmL family microcompartment protein [Planctomycetia bacterium]
MRISKVIGNVTLSRIHPTLQGGSFRLAVPAREEELPWSAVSEEGEVPSSEAVVVYDALGAGVGQWIGIGEGREAVNPFYPEVKPVDAYNALILDQLSR